MQSQPDGMIQSFVRQIVRERETEREEEIPSGDGVVGRAKAKSVMPKLKAVCPSSSSSSSSRRPVLYIYKFISLSQNEDDDRNSALVGIDVCSERRGSSCSLCIISWP